MTGATREDVAEQAVGMEVVEAVEAGEASSAEPAGAR